MARGARREVIDAPPGRYKVVERGRRLVVIDMRTGRSAARESPAGEATPPTLPVDTAAPGGIAGRGGHAVLTTSRIYDLKGPRRIAMTPAFNARFGRVAGGGLISLVIVGTVVTMLFPVLWLFAALALLQPKLRGGLRRWITACLDRAVAGADQAAS